MFDDDQEDVELSEETVKDLSVPEEKAKDVQGGMRAEPCPTGGQTTSTESCKSVSTGCC